MTEDDEITVIASGKGNKENKPKERIEKPKPPITTFFEWKITAERSTNPDGEMCSQFADTLDTLIAIDPTVQLYAYLESDEPDKPPIYEGNEVSQYIARKGFIKYFRRAYSRAEGGVIHGGVRLGHSVPCQQLADKCNNNLPRNEAGCYIKSIQVAETKPLGWLLWSTRNVEASALQEAIKTLTGIEVGVRWRPVVTDARMPTKVADRTYALHIETASSITWQETETLKNLWSSKNNRNISKPLGITLRFVPDKSRVTSQSAKAKIVDARNKQKAWNDSVVKLQHKHLNSIDRISTNNSGLTIRNIVMSMPSKTENTLLFTNVAPHYYQGIIFECIPRLRNEAQGSMDNLLPYLLQVVDDIAKEEIRKSFDPSHVEQMEFVRWMPETNEAYNIGDLEADEIDTEMANDTKYFFDMDVVAKHKENPTHLSTTEDIIKSPIESGHEDFSTVASVANYSTMSIHTTVDNEIKSVRGNFKEHADELQDLQDKINALIEAVHPILQIGSDMELIKTRLGIQANNHQTIINSNKNKQQQTTNDNLFPTTTMTASSFRHESSGRGRAGAA